MVLSYGAHKDSLKKSDQRKVTQKIRKEEQLLFTRHVVLTSYTLL